MKKIAIILAALLLALSVCACTDNDNPEETSGNTVIINPGETTGEADGSEETTTAPEQSADKYTFEDKDETVYVIAKNMAVNLRSDTLINDDTIVKSVANGTALKRTGISTDGEWSRVTFEDKTCYVKTKFLTTMEDPNEGFTAVSKTLTVKEGKSLWVRIVPDTINEYVGDLNGGDVVNVVAEKEGWYRIEYSNSITGADGEYYISSNPELFEAEEETTTAAAE